MEIKITRRQFLKAIGNEWCDHINFWLIHGRIYSDDGTRYRKFKFVAEVNFSCDGWDEENDRAYTESEILEDIIFSYVDTIHGYDDCKDFFDLCNASIDRWNDGVHRENRVFCA